MEIIKIYLIFLILYYILYKNTIKYYYGYIKMYLTYKGGDKMKFAIRIALPSFAIISSLFSILFYKIYIISGNHHKIINEAIRNLQDNLTNRGVADFINTLNAMKKIPNKNNNWDNLTKAYYIVKNNKAIDNDLKTQLRIALILKGIKKL